MFIVHYSKGLVSGYVRKHDGMNSFVADPREASAYFSKEDAHDSGRVGHPRDMGGDGIKGRVVPLKSALRDYLSHNEEH